MDFGNIRVTSAKIGNDRKLSKNVRCLPENVECIPLAVVIMTTAGAMQPTFSGRRLQLFCHFRSFRVITEFAEVQIDIARSILKSSRPLLPKLSDLSTLCSMTNYFN